MQDSQQARASLIHFKTSLIGRGNYPGEFDVFLFYICA